MLKRLNSIYIYISVCVCVCMCVCALKILRCSFLLIISVRRETKIGGRIFIF